MSLKDLSVLVCDDSMLVRKKMKEYLNSIEINNVFEACDGQQAIDMYKEKKPSVVFMDIVMPEKTGIEAVTEILEYDKKAKVVMASSVGTQSYLNDAISAGAYDFIQKPICDEYVLKVLQKVNEEG